VESASSQAQYETRIEQLTALVNKLNRELEATRAIGQAVNQSLLLNEVIDTSLANALNFMRGHAGALHIIDPHDSTRLSHIWKNQDENSLSTQEIAPLIESIGKTVIASSQPLLVEDISKETRDGVDQLRATELQSFACFPLIAKGRVFGALSIVSHVARKLRVDDADVLSIITSQVAVAIDNAQLFEETQRREREAEALCRVGLEISALQKTDKILESVVEKARRLIGTEAAALSLIDERSEEVFMKATTGIRTKAFKNIRLPKGKGLAGQVISSGQPVNIEDYFKVANTSELANIMHNEGLVAHLVAPIKFGDKVLGALYVYQRHPYRYSTHDEKLLMGLASQAAIAIENAQLYDQVQQLAILSERDRIARDMHDGLAQVLGYLILNSRQLSDLIKQDKSAQALVHLEGMRETLRETYNDVRASILGLRTTASISKGLVTWLEEYLRDYSNQTGIITELVHSPNNPFGFPPATEAQLGLIIQETLANTRKHANATHAWVRIGIDSNELWITVEDDGKGFEIGPNGPKEDGHFGLEIMQERAQSVGASLSIRSEPGKGTRVEMRLPGRLTPIQTGT
jgi:nitrate/nitrite-specific signal transduction histidine kinase